MTKLITMDGESLFNASLPPIRYVIQDLLPQGLHILAGAPKIGKSWLTLWLCLQTARGQPVWNFQTEQGQVLYLCLEDSFTRIQSRLLDLTDDAPANLHFAVTSQTIGDGLDKQIEAFLIEHPDTTLIAIDTLQRIRPPASGTSPYASDYSDIVQLKRLADQHRLFILLVHHLRKMADDDPVNMISGSTGISGGTDSSFVLKKHSRRSRSAVLYCTGRDIEYRELQLEFDQGAHLWNLLSDSVVSGLEPSDRILSLLLDFLKEHFTFNGTATELSEAILKQSGEQVSPNVLMKKLRRCQRELEECGICFSIWRTHKSRVVALEYHHDGCVGNDGRSVTSSPADLPPHPPQLSQNQNEKPSAPTPPV